MRNKVLNSTIMIFLILSAFLMASGTLVVLQMSSAMNGLFEIAQPPHFLQMHSGTINQEKIDLFTKSVPYVVEQESVQMLNIDSASIWYIKANNHEEISMSDNMMDNGFVVQNTKFDYLINQNNQIAQVSEGEIGVPISYKLSYDLNIGDKVVIETEDFSREMSISCFVRDAQMASSLASSIRFLVSKEDYKLLSAHLGNLEYILEYRLTDSRLAGDFQRLYEAAEAEMPTNGQAITYPLIKLLNGIAGGMLAGMMMLVSLILIAIAVLNLRFTILATIEEEQKEIGAMKAIGFSRKDIRDRYLSKYRILTIVGCIVGYLIALPITRLLVSNITLTFGESNLDLVQSIAPLLATIIVYVLVVQCCKKILKRIERISVVEGLVYGVDYRKQKKSDVTVMPIKQYKGTHINLYLALRECLVERRTWSLIVIVFLLAVAIMIIPVNFLNTLESPTFCSSMGSSECDVRIDLQFKDSMKERSKKVRAALEQDEDVSFYSEYNALNCEINGEKGYEPFLLQCGDYSSFPITCLEGSSPSAPDEIALSYLNAKKFNVKVGNTLACKDGTRLLNLTVCGIYQDVTAGGYTAKACIENAESDTQRYSFLINLNDSSKIETFTALYAEKFSFAKVMPMERFIKQTYGSVAESFKGAIGITTLLGIFIACLITVLFLKLQTVKDYSKCATLKAIGFGSNELCMQYMIKIFICAGIGIVLGIIAASTLGEMGINGILSLSGIGLKHFEFVPNVPFTWLVCPSALLAVALITTRLSQETVKHARIIDMISE